MSDFDTTENLPPFDLLTPEEKEAFEEWPHGWEVFLKSFMTTDTGDRLPMIVYRGKPAPIVHHTYTNVYKGGRTGSPFSSLSEALENAAEGRIKTIHITIDGNEVSATVLD